MSTGVSALRVVFAEGDTSERGRVVGRELGDAIGRSLAFYRTVFERRGLRAEGVAAFLAPFRAAAERELPEHVAWLDGLAEGAEVSPGELFAVNAFEELDPLLERCSTFNAVGPGYTILGHNELWLAGDAGQVAVVIDRVADDLAMASPTVACFLPAVGMNSRRVAQGVDSLAALDDGVGVPRVLVSRHALEAVSREDAVRRASPAGRAGGYGHVFALAGGEAFTVETTAHRAVVLDGAGAHTNHYLDPGLAELAAPPSAGSTARHALLEKLLEERRPSTADDAMALLRAHDVASSDPEPDDGDEAWAVLFSMVCDLEAGRMWVAAGRPATTPYEEVDLGDVV